MNCATVRACWLASTPLDADATAHLAACAECQMTQVAWNEVRRAVRGGRVIPSPDLATRTRLRVRVRAAGLRQRRRAMALLVATAGLSVGLTLASFRISWAFAGLLASFHLAPSRWVVFAYLNLFPVVLILLVAWTFGVWPSVGPEEFYG